MNSGELFTELDGLGSTLDNAIGDTFWVTDRMVEAVNAAANAVRLPDPETGLVPCGCGGKAEFLDVKWCIGDDGGVIAYCLNCLVKTAKHMTKEQATHDWNSAMGYKEEV